MDVDVEVRRLGHPQRVRGRLRARLQREVPQPPRRRDPRPARLFVSFRSVHAVWSDLRGLRGEANRAKSMAVDPRGRGRCPPGPAVPRAQRRLHGDRDLEDGRQDQLRRGQGDHLQGRRRPADAATLDNGDKVMAIWVTGQQRSPGQAGRRQQVDEGKIDDVQRREPQAQPARPDPAHAAPVRADRAAVPVPDEPGAGRRRPGHAVRQVQGQADHQGHAEDDVRRRRRLRGGDRGARRDQGVPPGAGQVPGRRRQDPQGRAALRPARHRQDAARARGRGRGRRPVLLDLRLGLRRDVRRRRRLPGARPVRAGQGERPRHRVHRRDRRRRPSPRRRHGRRSRRARADPQPAAGRDGRLRRPRRRHPDRRDQPPRHPRPGAAPPRPVRPPDQRRRPRPPRSRADPQGARARQADGARRRPALGGPPYAGLHRRRPGQRAQRGGAADRPRRTAS